MTTKTALIVGASRGLGLGLVQKLLADGWNVIATERSNNPESPLRKFASGKDIKLRIENIDINEEVTRKDLRKKLEGVTLDLLFINAGVASDAYQKIRDVSTEEFNRMLVTNALSPLKTIEALDDLVKLDGSIAVMSSGLGSVTNNNYGGHEVYCASKAALNMLLKSYATRTGKMAGNKRSLFAMVPGWVKTDMGGPEADLDVKTSTDGIINTINLHHGIPGVKFLDYQNNEVPW